MTDYLSSTEFISNQATNSSPTPFHPGHYQNNLKDAWSQAINENYWRHGLVISQGNRMNVSEDRCRERLKFIASRLLRAMYGNKYRRKGHKVHFIVTREGWKESYNLHYHILMAVEGDHDWSDLRIKLTLAAIDSLFLQKFGWHWEKEIHIDYDWKKINRYHSYSTDSIQRGREDWTVVSF